VEENNNMENLMIRCFSREISQEEEAELMKWVSLSAKNKSEFIALKDIWDASQNIPDRSEEQLTQFYKNAYYRSRNSQKSLIWRMVSVAAVLAIALVFSILTPQTNEIPTDGFQVFTVPLGSRSKVLLADGTEVNLNSGSILAIPNSFSSRNRVATLTGEAYFNVKTDAKHPFVVKTCKFDVKVTGTKFNVCAYNEDLLSTATLAEGQIDLQLHDCSKLLKIMPGEKFSYNRSAKKYTLKEADVDQEIAWKNGEFIFKKILFPDLVKRLERWYDVKLICTDNRLTTFSYSGRFKNQETIWQVFDALKLTSPIDYKRSSFREFKIAYRP
jgi:ferric-dicitrate binding protein FerR (iron transport regulator)